MTPRSNAAGLNPRHFVRRLLTRFMHGRSTTLDLEALAGSAVVFSPHFDDETLGCGGTILKKRRLGAPVKLVFMTDGRKSHEGWIAPDALARLRAEEGVAAAGMLGIDASDVHLLGFEETRLEEHAVNAKARVVELLRRFVPDEVYVPHALEPPADHSATNRIVMGAIQELSKPVVVYQYPIWVWDHWPWTALRTSDGPLRHLLRDSLRMNELLVRDFRHRVFVGDVLEEKRAALAQHATQTTRMNQDATWPILADVADGEFLSRFFQDYEVFTKT